MCSWGFPGSGIHAIRTMSELKSATTRSENQISTRSGLVLGPTGKPLTLEDLPPPGTQRWVIRRKAEVVAGVRGGLITLEEACRRYNLSIDEFRSWQKLLDSHGMQGLRTTKIKNYRQKRPRN